MNNSNLKDGFLPGTTSMKLVELLFELEHVADDHDLTVMHSFFHSKSWHGCSKLKSTTQISQNKFLYIKC